MVAVPRQFTAEQHNFLRLRSVENFRTQNSRVMREIHAGMDYGSEVLSKVFAIFLSFVVQKEE